MFCGAVAQDPSDPLSWPRSPLCHMERGEGAWAKEWDREEWRGESGAWGVGRGAGVERSRGRNRDKEGTGSDYKDSQCGVQASSQQLKKLNSLY